MQNERTSEFPSLSDIRPAPRIDILLPSKERFGPKNAGAISGVVLDLIEESRTPECFRVVGKDFDTPFPSVDFKGLQPRNSWLHGSNIGLAAAYLHEIRSSGSPDLVEVHSRCHVAAYIKKKRPDLKVALYLHNDPRDMKGARKTAERAWLLRNMSAIICVSDYIRDCFVDGIDIPSRTAKHVRTARNGVDRWLSSPSAKKPFVLVAGRIVPEKGILEFARASAEVLSDKPDWKIVVAGARRFEECKPESYEKTVANALAPLGERAVMTGFLPIDQIRKLQEEAEIIACPSVWQEPLGKTALEALAAGGALLTTRRGGIPEVAEGRAHIVDSPDVAGFMDAIERLVTDQPYRKSLQHSAWNDFPFTATRMATDADAIRAFALGSPRTG